MKPKDTAETIKDRFKVADLTIDHVHEGTGCYHRFSVLSGEKVYKFIEEELAHLLEEVESEYEKTRGTYKNNDTDIEMVLTQLRKKYLGD